MNKKFILIGIVCCALAIGGCAKETYYEATFTPIDGATDGATEGLVVGTTEPDPDATNTAVATPPPAESGPKVIVEEEGVKIVAVAVGRDKVDITISNETEKDIVVTGEDIKLNGLDIEATLEANVPAGSQDVAAAIQFSADAMDENGVMMISAVDLKIKVMAGEDELLSTSSKSIMTSDL